MTSTQKILLTIGAIILLVRKGGGNMENFIKQFEGFHQKQPDGTALAYPDPGYGWSLPTVGYGTTHYPGGAPVRRGDRVTRAQALEYLKHEADLKKKDILAHTAVPLTGNQLTALTSFAYNAGRTALFGSTLWKKLQARRPAAEVAAEFDKWVYSNGKKLPGLVERRAKEKALFLS